MTQVATNCAKFSKHQGQAAERDNNNNRQITERKEEIPHQIFSVDSLHVFFHPIYRQVILNECIH